MSGKCVVETVASVIFCFSSTHKILLSVIQIHWVGEIEI